MSSAMSTRFSGGGVVAEFFRDLQKPTRFGGGGGSSAEFFFSVTSKHNFTLMGPFFILDLSRRGGARAPWPPLNRPLDREGDM